MPSADGALRVFQVSSTLASIGFVTLLVQTVRAKHRKQKSQTKSHSPVTLSAVTSGDEPQTTTTADGGSLEPAKVEPKQAWEKPLRERIEALMPQAFTLGADDSTVETARAAAVYLLAAESLLRLRQGGTTATRAKLHADASKVVRDTTAATTSLRELREPQELKPGLAALAIGFSSYISAMVAFLAACWVQVRDFGCEVDLSRVTLRGEPRVTYLPPGLFTPVTSEAVRALHFVVAGSGMILGMVRSVVMFPADVAFSCLASISLLFGVPLTVATVATISCLAILVMMVFASASSAEAGLKDKSNGADEQH